MGTRWRRDASNDSCIAIMKSDLKIPLAIIVGGIIIAVAIYASIPKNALVGSGNLELIRPVSIDDHILGNPTAPVMIIEYSDFDCDFCKNFHDTLYQVIADAGTNGNVAWVFREFPLTEIHPNSLSHARAAECAAYVGGNDAFWKFSKALFANQPVNPTRYGELASSVGISGEAFATCFANASSTLVGRIDADRQNALDIGATGTPYSIMLVNGKQPVVMNGAYSYDAVRMLIDKALANERMLN